MPKRVMQVQMESHAKKKKNLSARQTRASFRNQTKIKWLSIHDFHIMQRKRGVSTGVKVNVLISNAEWTFVFGSLLLHCYRINIDGDWFARRHSMHKKGHTIFAYHSNSKWPNSVGNRQQRKEQQQQQRRRRQWRTNVKQLVPITFHCIDHKFM